MHTKNNKNGFSILGLILVVAVAAGAGVVFLHQNRSAIENIVKGNSPVAQSPSQDQYNNGPVTSPSTVRVPAQASNQNGVATNRTYSTAAAPVATTPGVTSPIVATAPAATSPVATTPAATSPIITVPATTASGTSAPAVITYFVIRELGLRFKLPADISDLTYTISNINSKVALFTTMSLEAKGGSLCSLAYVPLGTIATDQLYFAQTRTPVPTSDTTEFHKVNGAWAYYKEPEATCSDDASLQDLQTRQAVSLQNAFNSTVEPYAGR